MQSIVMTTADTCWRPEIMSFDKMVVLFPTGEN